MPVEPEQPIHTGGTRHFRFASNRLMQLIFGSSHSAWAFDANRLQDHMLRYILHVDRVYQACSPRRSITLFNAKPEVGI